MKTITCATCGVEINSTCSDPSIHSNSFSSQAVCVVCDSQWWAASQNANPQAAGMYIRRALSFKEPCEGCASLPRCLTYDLL
jgi:hypothetical protein